MSRPPPTAIEDQPAVWPGDGHVGLHPGERVSWSRLRVSLAMGIANTLASGKGVVAICELDFSVC